VNQTRKRNRNRIDTYEIITNRIISLLEKGVVPWRKPWSTTFKHPCNLVTKKPYRGINVLLLGCAGYGMPPIFGPPL